MRTCKCCVGQVVGENQMGEGLSDTGHRHLHGCSATATSGTPPRHAFFNTSVCRHGHMLGGIISYLESGHAPLEVSIFGSASPVSQRLPAWSHPWLFQPEPASARHYPIATVVPIRGMFSLSMDTADHVTLYGYRQMLPKKSCCSNLCNHFITFCR